MRHRSLLRCGGVFSDFIEVFSSTPRCALRKVRKGVMARNMPPMLAAQSALPSGALPGFQKIFDQLIWR
jgi:hypothetical protein